MCTYICKNIKYVKAVHLYCINFPFNEWLRFYVEKYMNGVVFKKSAAQNTKRHLNLQPPYLGG